MDSSPETTPSPTASDRRDEPPAAGGANLLSRVVGFVAGLPSGLGRRLERLDSAIWSERRDRGAYPFVVLVRGVRVASVAASGFTRHGLALRAGALTYSTVLSLVPLFAVVFSILQAMGVQRKLAEDLIERLTAGSTQATDALVGYIESTERFINESNVRGLTGFGVLGLLYVSLSMLRSVENAMNAVWGIRRGRSFGRVLSDYVSFVIIAPLVLGAGLYVRTTLRVPDALPLSRAIDVVVLAPALSVLPLLTTWAAFVFLYSFMPNARVRWFSALIGGVIAGGAWHAAQGLFLSLAVGLYGSKYDAIYRSFAWVFVQLIWIQLSWTILLLGAEIVQAHQNLDEHRRRRRSWRGTLAERETLALRALAILARETLRPLAERPRPRTLAEISDEARAPTDAVEETLEPFERAGIVLRLRGRGPDNGEGGNDPRILCRSARDVRVLDALRIVRHGSIEAPSRDVASSPEGGFLAEAGHELAKLLAGRTLADLAEMETREIATLRI